MKENTSAARLLLGDRPRVEIPLTPGALPAWLVVALPGPTSESRPEGRLLADPRVPESEIVFTWGEITAVPRSLRTLNVSVGGQSWTLEQDLRNPERWLVHAAPEPGRHWS
jgi:hypothetical protein